MSANATEGLPQHGLHRTELEVDHDRGVLRCTVCDFDVCQLAPEWLEHNTDVEDQTPDPPGPAVDQE